jgi:hypothetical protein
MTVEVKTADEIITRSGMPNVLKGRYLTINTFQTPEQVEHYRKLKEERENKMDNFIPENTKRTIDDYVSKKYPPGSFVYAVLCNNLSEAIGNADEVNAQHIRGIVCYVYNKIPSNVWGSKEKVDKHLYGEIN